MTIPITTVSLSTSGPTVKFTLSDAGSAHVSIMLFIAGVTPLPVGHDETYTGSKDFVFALKSGSYDCDLQISAFNTLNTLGPVYDMTVLINGVTAASARGAVPAGKASDFGFTSFKFSVV
jgi:hypothetical protein